MKTNFCFCALATSILLTLTMGCSKKSEADPQSAGLGSATIKLTRNGQVITEFQTVKATGVGGGAYIIVISSTDEKHNLSLSIEGQSPGTYPFINNTQALTSGKANFMYQSYALPEAYAGTAGILTPDTGEVVVKSATQTRCSGTFKGSGKNVKDGKIYVLEGTFDASVF